MNELLGVLADPIKREILSILKKERITSGDLAIKMKMSPQALSYHLNKMKKAGLLYESKYKNYIYYELDLTLLDQVILWLENFKDGVTNEKT